MLQPGDATLVAVSGGIDSMVMCHLFESAKYSFSICHIDHLTRGGESSKDAEFVKRYAQDHDIPFFSTTFQYDGKDNFQSAARKFRYDYLEKIRAQQKLTKIATAHHLNDVAESLILNIARGAGLAGMSGIAPRNGHVIRPLLFATKGEILAYSQKHNVAYREDSTNATNVYRRNAIRNNIIPQLDALIPYASVNIAKSAGNARDATQLLEHFIDQNRSQFVEVDDGDLLILKLDTIKEFPGSLTLLFMLLKKFEFSRDQINSMLSAHTGSVFTSTEYQAYIDRDRITILKSTENLNIKLQIPKIGTFDLGNGLTLEIKKISVRDVDFSTDIQYLDFSKIFFPLHVRKWENGDTFSPLGMKGKHQKLQDYFVNHKLSRWEKENVCLLLSEERIVSILGYQIDDHYKITETTQQALYIKFQQPVL